MNIEKKKKNNKTKKQNGGLLQQLLSSPLATIFRFGSKRNNPTSIRNIANKTWSEQPKLEFINTIKEFLLSPEYQRNVPVFYGNQLNTNKSKGYNEHICKIVGVFSSRKRIFIINPFAEFVYRIFRFCIANNYINDFYHLQNLLIKLLKLDNFTGFPEIKYLPYGIRFCIVKDENGIENVITSQQPNISRCRYGYGCSLMMSAEIREENLPSKEDISELHDILGIDDKLWKFYHLSKNKAKYNRILKSNYQNNKLSKEYYFTNILSLYKYLDKLQNLFIQSKQNNDYIETKKQYRYTIIEIKKQYKDTIIELFNKIVESYTLFPELKLHIDPLISQDLSKNTLQYSILLEILELVINQIKTNEDDFGLFLPTFEKLKNKYKLIENKYFDGIIQLLLGLNNLKNQILQLKQYNENISRIEKNSSNRTINIIKYQKNIRQNLISSKTKNILSLQNSDISELQQLYDYLKLQLQQPNVDLLEVSTKLIKKIKKLIIDLDKLQSFMSVLETKPVEKSTILKILEIS